MPIIEAASNFAALVVDLGNQKRNHGHFKLKRYILIVVEKSKLTRCDGIQIGKSLHSA